MSKKIILQAFLVLLLSSCTRNAEKQTDLERIEIFDDKQKLANTFYINSLGQKDSIEEKFNKGELKKTIFWQNGIIDSIQDAKNDLTTSKRSGDSLFYTFNKKGSLIQKSEINYEGEYDGISFKYEDSILSSATEYRDGQIKGLVVNFNKEGFPSLIGDIEKGSFFFGIQFYEKGKIKSLRINDQENRLGLIYHYHPNGNLKSKVELLDGVAEGIELNYNQNGTLVSKRELTGGIVRH